MTSYNNGAPGVWPNPSDASVAQVTVPGGTARTLADRFADVFNVRDYGATGDGVTDDLAAIQAAVTSAIAAATGGRSVVLDFPTPDAFYAVSGMIDLSRTGSAAALTVRGNQSLIKYTGTSAIEAVMKSRVTGSPPTNNKRLVVSGLVLHGNDHAYYGLKLHITEPGDWAEYANVSNCQIYHVTGVGLDMDGSMLSSVRQLIIEYAGIGLRLRAMPSGGGGNANRFEDVSVAYAQIGILFYSVADTYPMQNNQVLGPNLQGNSVADVAVIGGNIENIVFQGGHFESAITAGTAAVDLGTYATPNSVTISKGRIVVYSSSITMRDNGIPLPSYFGAHSDVQGGRSAVQASVEVANGGTGFTDTLSVKNFRGSQVFLDRMALVAESLDARFSYAQNSVVMSRNVPPYARAPVPNELKISGANSVAPAGAVTETIDPELGRVQHITFDPTVGSYGPNCLTVPVLRVWAQYESAYFTGMVRSSQANAAFYLTVVGSGGVIGCSFTVPLANTWYLVRITGSTNQAINQTYGFGLYPLDTKGATVDLARMAVLATPAFNTGSTITGPAVTTLLNDNAGPGDRYASATWDPPSIAAGAFAVSTGITVGGSRPGDTVRVIPPAALTGLVATGEVTANDTVQIALFNPTGGAVDLASGSWTVRVTPAF